MIRPATAVVPPRDWHARYWHFKAEAHRDLIRTIEAMLADALRTGAGEWNPDTEQRWTRTRARLQAELEAYEANAAAYASGASDAPNTPEQGETEYDAENDESPTDSTRTDRPGARGTARDAQAAEPEPRERAGALV